VVDYAYTLNDRYVVVDFFLSCIIEVSSPLRSFSKLN
jgi:hypothetical protein